MTMHIYMPLLLLTTMSPTPDTTPAAIRAELQKIDDDIDELRARLAATLASRRCVVARLQAVTYDGILNLPSEILGEIFDHCTRKIRIGCRDPSAPQLTLTVVCREWRRVALSLPSLWSKLAICNAADPSRQYWLKKSRSYPLDLEIGDSEALPGLMEEVALRLARYTSAFHALVKPAPIFDECRGKFVGLQSLTLESSHWSSCHMATHPPLTLFADAPVLHAVTLAFVRREQIVLPWEQITTFSVSGVDRAHAYDFLKSMPQLESLTMSVSRTTPHDDADLVYKAPPLAHLHTLEINLGRELDYEWVKQLWLPKLTHLVARNIGTAAISPFANLLRHTPALTSLEVHGVRPATAQEILRFTAYRAIDSLLSLDHLRTVDFELVLEKLPLLNVVEWVNKCPQAPPRCKVSLRERPVGSWAEENYDAPLRALRQHDAASSAKRNCAFDIMTQHFRLSSQNSPLGSLAERLEECSLVV
ncbi:hypothetical protein MIND_01429600 [Mycena indigotica]|uniref:F-box domain-containing protein n=1 Tax=Mycena indigotica TaxID=2126181 RepID=A0A8H6VP95_9AGAR|nr:uncharacterized protein MIND_01429600 [Mycena indigotica]KAF7288629.1 hypothetical protein MIND_01429600 [Mycena indigotica]